MKAITEKLIENRIYNLRDKQVMLDSDLAYFYETETKFINRAVKRNTERFPDSFVFQLNEEEWRDIRIQNGTFKGDHLRFHFGTSSGHGGRRILPFVFTEQGVAMLSAVLHSEVAIRVSIQIMQVFVNMRAFLLQNATVFQRLDNLELRQLKADRKIEQLFKILDSAQPQPDKGIFFSGHIFDAYVFVSELIKKATKEIVLIDNYVDESVLTLFSKRKPSVEVTIYTKSIGKSLLLDAQKHNEQYPFLSLKTFVHSHDRFLLIDSKELYHFGASLKDLGKKWFAFSRMDSFSEQVKNQLKEEVK
jgi:hypothetical protein